MRYLNNERGSILVLVLFLMLMISVLSAPLLLSAIQGQKNSIAGGNLERANYIAESGVAILQNVLIDAVRNEKMRLDANEVNALVNQLNSADLNLYDNRSNPKLSLLQEGSSLILTSEGRSGYDGLERTRLIILSFVVSQGDTGIGADGIFGKDVVTTQPFAVNRFVREDGAELNYDDQYDPDLFEEELTSFYNSVFKNQSEPLSPLEPDLTNLTQGNLTITENNLRAGRVTGNITISGKNLTIPGDLVAGGDIIFESVVDTIQINGNLIAGGKIIFTNTVKKLTITQSVISNGDIIFQNTAENVDITGTVSSKNNIIFKNTVKDLWIGGSLISGKETRFENTVTDLTVGGDISSGGKLEFYNTISFLSVGKSVISKNEIVFRNTISDVNITGNLISQDKIIIRNTTRELHVGGSIVSASELIFENTLDRIQIEGNLISLGNITFRNVLSNITISHFMSSLGNMTFDNQINNIKTGGICAGGQIKTDFFKPLIIKYNPPEGGGSDPSITFGEWSSE